MGGFRNRGSSTEEAATIHLVNSHLSRRVIFGRFCNAAHRREGEVPTSRAVDGQQRYQEPESCKAHNQHASKGRQED